MPILGVDTGPCEAEQLANCADVLLFHCPQCAIVRGLI